jgi:cbb3-type cytochrome oxidase subunit 3
MAMSASPNAGVQGNTWLMKIWRVARWVLLVIFLLYVALVVYRYPTVMKQKRSEEVAAYIRMQKLTREVVLGNLPPAPDKAINDATVAGVDSNHNGIRDDVERAIYYAHKDSASVVAAEYQYAMTEQMFLTEVIDENTWKAVAEGWKSCGLYCKDISSNRSKKISNRCYVSRKGS